MRRWLGIIGIQLAVLGQFFWFLLRDSPLYGALPALAGMALLVLAPPLRSDPHLIAKNDAPGAASPAITKFRVRFRWRLIVPGFGLSLLAGLRADTSPTDHVLVLLLFWISGSGLVFGSLMPKGALRAWLRRAVQANRTEIGVVIALTAAGFILRAVDLEVFPPVFAEDEAYFALQAAQLAERDAWHGNPFRYDVHFHPMVFHTLQAAPIAILGHTMTAARLPAALIGALSIPGVYLLGRRMLGVRVALLAGLFMVTFPAHLQFSRLALNQALDPTFAAWTLAFLAGALRTGDPVEFGLAGVTLGLSQYGFSSSRLIPILAASYIALQLLTPRRALIQQGAALLIPLLLTAVLVLPQAFYLLRHGVAISPRQPFITANASPDAPVPYWIDQIVRSAMAFTQQPDRGIFYGPFDPLLGWVAGVPFMIGLALTIKTLRRPESASLMLWIATTVILGGIILADSPEYQRYVIVLPALAILVALGLDYLSGAMAWLIRQFGPLLAVHIPRYVPVVLAILLALFNLKVFFADYRAADAFYQSDWGRYLNALAVRVLPVLRGYSVLYVSSPNLGIAISPTVRYLSPEVVGAEFTGSPADLTQRLREPDARYAVILSPGNSEQVIREYQIALAALPNMVRMALPDQKSPLAESLVYLTR